ncbi:DUF6350 family protein [Streptomyces sp. NRRL F-5126]|uniref:cell division protein PerM n=1 Tax=Streptomyces sp. NRRL F-5126 TaxID=1463857 RepID=UPI00131C2941|nr:DUF6350 family protein [Streptomyces sp. NRRL F-5126]
MTQVTERGESLSSASALERGRAAALTASFLRGSIAACLGLGTVSVLVMALWISSPYPDSSASGALHVAFALWLLAHGVDLVRPGTLGGAPAPVGTVPLLLTAVPCYLAHRAAREALEPQRGRPQLTAIGAVATVSGGYLLVGACATWYAQGGALTASPLRAAAFLPLVVIAATSVGAWTATGRPPLPLPRWLPVAARAWCGRTLWSVGARRLTGLALRAGAASVAVLLGGGAVLVAVSLIWHVQEAEASFLRLSVVWSGRFAVMLLGLVLVPNAAVWGASYGLGPGFALSTTATVGPLSGAGTGATGLPSFPLLAAVPQSAGGWPHWSAAAVPVAAALTGGWFTVRKAAPAYVDRSQAWSAGGTALAAALSAVVAGGLTALLAAAAGGPLGTGSLAAFGPVWWTAGAAALLWTAALAVPSALAVRVWRLRGSEQAAYAEDVPEPRSSAAPDRAAPEEGSQETPGRWARLTAWWARHAGTAETDGTDEADEATAPDGATTPAGSEPAGPAMPTPGVPGAAKPVPVASVPQGAQPPDAEAGAEAPARRWTRPATWWRRKARPEQDTAAGAWAGGEAYDFLSADSWHERGAREARLAGLKQVSEDTMADFSTTYTSWQPPVSRPPDPPAPDLDASGPDASGGDEGDGEGDDER